MQYLLLCRVSCVRILELLIYRMKDMAAANSCAQGLTVGSLKQRRIDGSEVKRRASERERELDILYSHILYIFICTQSR